MDDWRGFASFLLLVLFTVVSMSWIAVQYHCVIFNDDCVLWPWF